MKTEVDLIPDKVNEQPTVWIGLTMAELVRIGTWCFIGSLLFIEMPLSVAIGTLSGIFLSFLVVIITTALSVFIGGKIMSSRKAGKPYGYFDQKAAIRKSQIGIGKIPCITRTGHWTNKRTKL